MIYHPQTISIYHLLNPKDFDVSSLSTIELFKLDIAKNIINSLLLYPTLTDLYFDFKEIDRIANVWEGSDEETVSIGEFGSMNNFEDIPYFDSIEDALHQNNLQYYPNNQETYQKCFMEIGILFNFLTEEPSFTTQLLKSFPYKKYAQINFRLFSSKESFNLLLESEIINFLGSSLISQLRHHKLSQVINTNTTQEKKKNKL